MRALWIEDGALTTRDDIPRPEPGPGEALIRVVRAGICGTDLQLLDGYASWTGIPGHEFVGVVERGPAAWLGRRVVSEINVTCPGSDEGASMCRACASGRSRHCERRTVIGIRGRHGAFAEWVTAPVDNLHRVPDGLPDETAVFAEPLAAALRIREQVDLRPDDRVLVVGPGRLGQLVARGLVGSARIEVAARSTASRDRARSAGILVLPLDEVETGGYDVVVDCTGAPEGFATARRAVRPEGSIVVKSTYGGDVRVDMSGVVVDEVRLLGSRCGPFEPALDALASGAVEVADLVDERYPLESGPAAFERAAGPGVGKVLLTSTAA
ncbi:MAG: alcohol dehydrogenase catalytic domain-containing protein [Gemmatimonadetes bacterium]|nr:alcohol dehydrogenase catalytic domain-containing protein [Gemmatimonadota bacterium]